MLETNGMKLKRPSPGVCRPSRTDNSEELVGAAVREEAAHGVPMWGRGQTLLAVLMGLEEEEREQND